MRTKIIAHRGASGDFPEQSWEAFQGALAQNADGLECDVRLTSDGEIFCWHDRDIARLTGSKGNISKLSLDELMRHKISGSGIPISFLQVLELAITNKKDLLIETKHPVPTGGLIEREVIREINKKEKEIFLSGIKINIMSFAMTAISRISNLAPSIEPVFLVEHPQLIAFTDAPIIGLDLEIVKADPDIFHRIQAIGKKIYVWTVNEPRDIEMCAENAVDAIITDYPARAMNTLGYS